MPWFTSCPASSPTPTDLASHPSHSGVKSSRLIHSSGQLAMAADLNTTLNISAGGMDAQTTRLRVIAQNIANQESTGASPGADPYRRKTITFQSALDRTVGVEGVRVKSIGV